MSALFLHPLDLPELVTAIRLHLARKDLTVCLLVCRQWYTAFLPLVWKNVTKTPTAEALQRHAHLVEAITCENEFSPAVSRLTFPNLTALTFRRVTHRYDNRHQPWPMLSLTLFLQNNHTVTSLFFDDDFSPHAPQFWRAVADLPHPPRVLKVCSAFLYVESSVDFLEACLHAETLDFKFFRTKRSAPSVEDIARIGSLRFQSLKTLTLIGISLTEMEHFYTVLSHCPALERLSLAFLVSRPVMQHIDRLVSVARTRPWPVLKHVCISIPQLTDVQSQDLLQVLTPHPLVSLEVHFSLTPQAFSSLIFTQFPTITHLTVMVRQHPTTSEMNQRILRLCPLLISFKGGCISSADVIDGPFAGPWACLRLEKLCLAIDITMRDLTAIEPQIPPPQSSAEVSEADQVDYLRLRLRRLKQQEVCRQHRGVFEQLARLTRLRVLDVSAPEFTIQRGVSFRLDYGLAILQPLHQLRSVMLDKTSQPLKRQDLEWMVQHWKRLQSLEGFSTLAAGAGVDRTGCHDILRQHQIFF